MFDSSADRNPVEILAEDFVERVRRGEKPTLEEYVARYPHLAEEIRDLFPALVMMEDVRPGAVEVTGEFHGAKEHAAKLDRLGDYRILREIGRGGMGIVYEAEQESLGRHVALKVLPSHQLLDHKLIQRFQREARAAARLHHTNIVPVFGVGEANGLHYYVMQFIQGQGLHQVLAELQQLRRPGANTTRTGQSEAAAVAHSMITGRFNSGDVIELQAPGAAVADGPSSVHLPGQSEASTSGRQYWQSVARIGVQVAQALSYATAQGILHRDIKPSNLLLDTHGIVWVADFGLAKAIDSEDLTHTGDILGTLRYMAPERFQGKADIRSDIYSLGLTLYELATLRPGFDEKDRHKLIQLVTHEEPLPPRRINSEVPRDLETIILKAIARDPDQRYQTAADLAADLQNFVEDRPIKARRVSARERFWRWCRRNPVVAGLGAAVTLLLVAVTGVSVYAALQANAAADLADASANRDREAAKKAKRAQLEGENLIGQQYVQNGMNLLEKGDVSGAALWFTEALAKDSNDPERAKTHRLRLGSFLSDCPRPDFVCVHDDFIIQASYSPDGKWILTASEDNTAKVWDAQTGELIRTLGPFEYPVLRAVFSNDGKRILTTSGTFLSDKQPWEIPFPIHVWDAATGKALYTGRLHFGARFGLDDCEPMLSPDGAFLVLRGSDLQIQCIHIATGQLHGKTALPGHDIWFFFFSPDGKSICTVSQLSNKKFQRPPKGSGGGPLIGQPDQKHEISFWNLDGTLLRSTELVGNINRCQYTSDGTLLIISGRKRIEGLEVATGKRRWDLAFPSGPGIGSNDATLSPDAKHLLVFNSRMTESCQIYEVATGQRVGQAIPAATDFALNRVQLFSPDGRRVIVADSNHAAIIYSVSTGLPATQPMRFDAKYQSFQFHPDGSRLLSITADNAVRIWDTSNGAPMTPLFKHDDAIDDAKFHPHGTHVLTRSGRTVRQWPIIPAKAAEGPKKMQMSRFHPVFCLDGRSVLLMANSPRDSTQLVRWEWTSGRQTILTSLPAANYGLRRLEFSPNGRLVAFEVSKFDHPSGFGPGSANPATADSEIRLLEIDSGKEILRVAKLPPSSKLRFNSDSKQLLTAHMDGTVRVWDTKQGNAQLCVEHKPGPADGFFSPDGTRLFTHNLGGMFGQPKFPRGVEVQEGDNGKNEIRTWDISTGKRLGQTIKPKEYVNGGWYTDILPTLDGKRLLVLRSGTITLLDADTGQEIGEPMRTLMQQTSVSISPDGRYFLQTAGNLGMPCHVQIRATADGKPVGGPLHHQSNITDARFSPNGAFVVTASHDKTARVWQTETGEPITPPLVHDEGLTKARFSSDSRRLITSSVASDRFTQNFSARVWDTLTGQPLTPSMPTYASFAHFEGMANSELTAVLVLSAGGTITIKDLVEESRPLEDLTLLTRLLSGRRLSGSGSLMPLESDKFVDGWQGLQKKRPHDLKPAAIDRLAWHRQQAGRFRASAQLGIYLSAGSERNAFTAHWHAERLLEATPEDASAWSLRGGTRADMAMWTQALDDFQKARTLDPKNLEIVYSLAEAQVYLKNTQDALANFQLAIEDPTLAAPARNAVALLRLQSSDLGGYQETCSKMLKHALSIGAGTNDARAELLHVCTAGEPSAESLKLLIELVDRGQMSGAGPIVFGNPYGRDGRAEVYYRADRFEKARKLLQDRLASPSRQYFPADFFFLAMTNFKLKLAKEARDALDQGIKRQEELVRERESKEGGLTIMLPMWQQSLIEQLLRREAEELLK